MAQARKSMAKTRNSKKMPLPGWIWLTTGLLIGLFVAFLVYLKDNFQTTPTTASASTSTKTDAREVRKNKQADELPPPPTRTRFDFYTILPEMEVAVPDEDIDAQTTKPNTAAKKPGTYILQAGAFKKAEQAERMKASLALIGIEASVQTVTVDNKQTWHRVRIGPYRDLQQLNQVRNRLRENKINAILLRIKT